MSRAATTPTELRPNRLDAAVSARVAGLIRVAARARRRIWLGRASRRLAWVVAPLLTVYAVWALAARATWLAAEADGNVAIAAAIGLVGGLLWMLWRRPGWLEAAATLDDRGAGGDRVSTALDLARQGRADPWARVQAQEATQWAEGLDLPALLPMPRPQGIGWAAAAAALAALALFLPQALLLGDSLDARPAEGLQLALPPGHAGVVVAAELLGADALELLRADAALLADVESQVDDAPTRRWLRDVRRVIEDVEAGAIDRREALARLAELEAARPEPPEQRPTEGEDSKEPTSREAAGADERDRDRAVKNALGKAVEQSLDVAPKSAEREDLRKAAKEGDLGAMAKVLEKLADRDMSDKELEGWVKAAEKLAKALGVKQVPKQFDELAEKIRRLEQKRREQGGLTPMEQRRLHNARRALDALRREHGDVAGAKHQLQRLERGARQAADEMRRMQQERGRLDKQRGGSAEDQSRRAAQRKQMAKDIRQQMQRAANEMRRQGEGQRSRQARRIGDSRLRDLRQALRRGASSDKDRRDFSKRARGQQAQQGQQGQQGEQGSGEQGDSERQAQQGKPGEQGKDGAQGQGRETAEQAARRRAAQREAAERRQAQQGQQGEGGRKRPGAGLNPTGRIKLGAGDMPDNSRMRQMAGQGKPGGAGKGQGEGYGEGEGGAESGTAKRIGAARTEKVRGQQGDGPSTKQVFVDAARKGFAKTGWRDVYAEYSEVAEEMLEKESLPPGRKAMVRRYYELIRPRGSGE
ncbi:MAG: hypothetical protein H6747_02405 [Deltaproteobacteria bacterium]|nr:hypothetical protein [Deltaproteobacteria bacterium]